MVKLPKTNTKPKQKMNPRQVLSDYQAKIEKSLENSGVELFDVESGRLTITEDYLTLPGEITDVPSHELGEYLNAFTQQKVYMRTLLGRVELLVEEARRVYHAESDELYRKHTLSKMTETAKERLVNADKDVRPHYELYMDAKSKQKIIQYSLESIEDIIFLLSREVTRRFGDFTDENRNHNVGGR